MTSLTKGIAVLAVQLVLVLSVAGKYAWERHSCPRVWTRTAQFDPEHPLRGRYLSLSLTADACSLSHGVATEDYGLNSKKEWSGYPAQRWDVRLQARDNKLVAMAAGSPKPDTETVTLRNGASCQSVTLNSRTEFFIAEHAKTPFPLQKGEELWAEVTVPPSGPPRPNKLAVSDGKQFRVLDLR